MKFSVLEPDGGGEESLENYLKLSEVYPADFRLMKKFLRLNLQDTWTEFMFSNTNSPERVTIFSCALLMFLAPFIQGGSIK